MLRAHALQTDLESTVTSGVSEVKSPVPCKPLCKELYSRLYMLNAQTLCEAPLLMLTGESFFFLSLHQRAIKRSSATAPPPPAAT